MVYFWILGFSSHCSKKDFYFFILKNKSFLSSINIDSFNVDTFREITYVNIQKNWRIVYINNVKDSKGGNGK